MPKWLKRKAAKIEANRWAEIADHLDDDEQPIDFAGTYFLTGTSKEPGHTFVTDRNLIVTAPITDTLYVFPWNRVSVEPRQIEKGRLIGRVYGMVVTVGASRFGVEALPGTEPIFERLWPEITKRAGLGGGAPE